MVKLLKRLARATGVTKRNTKTLLLLCAVAYTIARPWVGRTGFGLRLSQSQQGAGRTCCWE